MFINIVNINSYELIRYGLPFLRKKLPGRPTKTCTINVFGAGVQRRQPAGDFWNKVPLTAPF
jgi:hypothetical protein